MIALLVCLAALAHGAMEHGSWGVVSDPRREQPGPVTSFITKKQEHFPAVTILDFVRGPRRISHCPKGGTHGKKGLRSPEPYLRYLRIEPIRKQPNSSRISSVCAADFFSRRFSNFF
jgi:hypothetical protein